ncbi:MAG TPA: hypothetical protein VLH39_07210, partial [Magnetospirillaceae bacterium]|nr:hypothetical protein [Magnetospirillaceae bacterium]
RMKPTLFQSSGALSASGNAGFAFTGAPGAPDLALRAESGGAILTLSHDDWISLRSPPTVAGGELGASGRMAALARVVLSNHQYLAGGSASGVAGGGASGVAGVAGVAGGGHADL